MVFLKNVIKGCARFLGYEVVRTRVGISDSTLPYDLDERFVKIYQSNSQLLGPFTPKLYTTYKATEYILKNRLVGDFVECGVFRGRHIALMALTLLEFGEDYRTIFLYDTFAGMTAPTRHDVKKHRPPLATYEKNVARQSAMQRDSFNLRCYAPIGEVKETVFATGYPTHLFKFIVGDVLETIPNCNHNAIALLRLDTDWYETTKHELIHLYDLVSEHGVVISDDYGTWLGCRKAIDEFFDGRDEHPFLGRTSDSERFFFKRTLDNRPSNRH